MKKLQAISQKSQSGFTLIEILVVIGLVAILAAIVIIAINPARQFAQGRNSQRTSNVNAILNAIGQNMADNKGIFNCSGVTVPVAPAAAGLISKAAINLRSCLVPTYISELPFDPSTGSNTCTSAGCAGAGENYDTKYTVQITSTGRTEVCAPGGAETAIPGSLAICVTR